jgi:hypothetical protein
MEEVLIKVVAVMVGAIAFGAFMIWRGASGDVWRSPYTGDAVIPAWMYIVTGALAIIGALGYVVIGVLLAKG